MPNISSDLDVQVIDQLAERIRAALEAARQAQCNALRRALEVGDALIEARNRVSTGWKRWLQENCSLKVRSALLYQQLAQHRAEIEAEIDRVGELSLRAARRLVMKPVARDPRPSKSDLTTAWGKATAEERTRHLDAVGVPGLLGAISLAFRRELEGRLRRLKFEDAPPPDYKLTMAFRVALGHLKAADDPATSRPVALSQETAALNALRGLARMHPDFNALSVGFQEAVDPKRAKRRRAA
jgi:hypothetical protein